MRELCVLCKKIHDDQNWMYGQYETIEGTRYGWFCKKWFKPQSHEFVPEKIREARKKYKKDILQPYRGGSLSQEFVEAYPREVAKMVRSGAVSKKDVSRAKNVWKGDV